MAVETRRTRYRTRRRDGVIAFAFCGMLACALLPAPPAHAQVVVIVNGDPVTAYDIEQRSKFIQLSQRKVLPRQQILNELIDEKLKIQIGKRYRLEIGDAEVEAAYADMAHRMRLNAQQLNQALSSGGVDPMTLKERLKADIVWQNIVRGKYQSSLQINEKEITAALVARKKDDKELVGTEYKLVPILLVVARGSPSGTVETRKREAETLRARFENCKSGIQIARLIRDVAIRDTITRTSADLSPDLRALLEKMTVGRLTEPEITAQGVEMFGLCSKRETKLNSTARREVQNELFTEQFQARATRLLKGLRKQAMIEYKEAGHAKPDGKAARDNAR